MSNREHIEARIQEVLASETSAIRLSHELFHRGGLFGQLANSRAEREALIQTLLFREAQRRLSDLQEKESDKFRQALRNSEPLPLGGAASAIDLQQIPQ